MLIYGRESEQIEELLSAKTGLLQDHKEGAALDLSAMERDGDDARVVGVPVVAVRAGGVVKTKVCTLQSPNDGCPRARRQVGHAPERLTRIRSVMGSPCSMGIASPCFRRLSRYPQRHP